MFKMKTDFDFIKRCEILAKDAAAKGESPVGSLISKNGEIVCEAIEASNNSEPQALPEKKYVDGMKLKNPNKTFKTIVTVAVIGLTIAAIIFFKNKKRSS